ncbi:hypothetical protein COOONC_16549 [Cooperia oncophora]
MLSSPQGRRPAQPPPLSQLKSATIAPQTMPTQTSKQAAPSLPVPARPPTIHGTIYRASPTRRRPGTTPMGTSSQTSPTTGRRITGAPIQRMSLTRSASTRSGVSGPTAGRSTTTSGQTALQPTPGTAEKKVIF